jgi:hypothetical protein
MADTRDDKRVYLQPAFLICVVVLAVAAGASRRFGVIEKEFLPLKKPFDALDERRLAPYKVIEKLKIEDKDMLKALGTQDYIQWILEDTTAPAGSVVQRLMLFVTYYGRADRVPHVPEECMAGGGFQQLASDSVTFEVKKAGFERKIDGEYLVFSSKKSDFREKSGQITVLYFFRVSGKYAVGRSETRFLLNKNLFRKYSYFSKVELDFNQTLVAPSKEEAVAAGEKLLAVVLPVLEEEHWPDFEQKR